MERTNMLTPIQFVEIRKGKRYWLYKCQCGNRKIIRKENVVAGLSKSCGCSSYGKKNALKHGGKGTKMYSTWRNIKKR